MGEWGGEERRSIPIHILNHIDGRIDDLREEITQLTNSVNSWMEKTQPALVERCEKIIDEAIPSHPENPDASPAEKRHEHRKAHAQWIQTVTDEMQRWKRIREKAIEWAVIGGLGVMAIALWQYLLKGPN